MCLVGDTISSALEKSTEMLKARAYGHGENLVAVEVPG
jgi:hypothetical protein